MSAPDWPLGHIVGRRYTVQQVLGRTPFTRTYAALTEPNKEVVLRVYGSESNDAVDEMMERLPDYATFPEPGILRVLEIGSDPTTGARFIVTERSRHPSLASMVELCALAPTEALAFAQRLATTIDRAHERKLLHLGLKATNVFVGTMPDGGFDVSDFGAPRVGPISFEQARWQAPEQIAEHQPSGSADVFSVALLVFYAMTGKSFWRATGVEELAAELSAPRVAASVRAKEIGVSLGTELDVAFAAALASDTAKRPAYARDFAGALAGKPLVIPTRTSVSPRPTVTSSGALAPAFDVAPPPQDLIARVAPILAPRPMIIGAAPPARLETPSPQAGAAPSVVIAPDPPAVPWKDEAPTDPIQPEPIFHAPPPPRAVAWPAPRVVHTKRRSRVFDRRRATTLALSALAATLFILAGIIMIIALRKKPVSATPDPVESAVPTASASATELPPIATTVFVVAPSTRPLPSSAPAPTTSPVTPNDSTTPTLALGPKDSELLIVCEPQPCNLVMVDRKKMLEYPGPAIVPPGAHGVGYDADGCWGGWKLVTTKAGERTVLTFTLNKRPPGVPDPNGTKKKKRPF